MRHKYTHTILFFLAFMAVGLPSCFMIGTPGEGEVVVEEIDIDLIDGIEIDSSIDVIIHYGPNQKVEVHGQKNLIDLLSRDVSRDKWTLDFTESVNYSKKFEVHLTLPLITSVDINGSGNVTTATPMKGKDLEIEINGSGNVIMEINVNELTTEIDGSGNVQLTGRAKTHTINVNGSGNIDAEDLITADAEIYSNGSGTVKVSVSGILEVDVNGSGDVYYYENPKELKMSKSGSGIVEEG